MIDRPSQVQSYCLNNSQHPEAKPFILEKKTLLITSQFSIFQRVFNVSLLQCHVRGVYDNLGVFSPTSWSPCLGPFGHIRSSVFTCLLSQDSRQHMFQNHQRGCLHCICSGPTRQFQHQAVHSADTILFAPVSASSILKHVKLKIEKDIQIKLVRVRNQAMNYSQGYPTREGTLKALQ